MNNTTKQNIKSNSVCQIKPENSTLENKIKPKNDWITNYNDKLDNYVFRKSMTKKSEKVEINCVGSNIIKEDLSQNKNNLQEGNNLNLISKENLSNKQNDSDISNIDDYYENVNNSEDNEPKINYDEIKKPIHEEYLFIKEILDEIKLSQYLDIFKNKEIKNLEKLFSI